MNKITVLYPGGFKPCHGGHLNLIEKYANHPEVEKIKVLIGQGVRDGIEQEKAFGILRLLISNDKIVPVSVRETSPILACYNIIKYSDTPNIFALAASDKEEENKKRIKEFVFKHSKEGKFFRENIQVIELPVNISPLLFSGRTDEYNGKPISASVLRNDLKNDDFQNFQTGYPGYSKSQIEFIWNILKS